MNTIAYPNILLDALESGIMIVDESFTVHYWNRWLEINTGIDPSSIIGKNLEFFYPEIDYKVLSRKIRTTLRLHSPTFYDASLTNRFIPIPRNKITTSLLSTMQLQVTISPYIQEAGMVMVSIYDISDLHELKLNLQHQIQQTAELNAELRRDREIIDSNLLIAKIDTECRVMEVTKAFLLFFGYDENSLIGIQLAYILGNAEADFDSKSIREAMEHQYRWTGEIKAFFRDGEGVWLDAVVTPVKNEAFEIIAYTVIFHDISDKKRIEHLSITDPLTKLFNRHKFSEVFENMMMRRHWTSKNSFGLIMMDIDYFKRINDIYGHQVGDGVLINVAHTLSKTIRTGDVLARWGGEEFVCLLPDVDIEKLLYVAEKIRSAIEETQTLELERVTGSFGVSIYVLGDTEASLLHRADMALYKAKAKGRNRIEFA